MLRGIGQQGGGSEEKQAAFCSGGGGTGRVGSRKSRRESRHQRKNLPRRCSAMLILEKLEENRLLPRASEKLKKGGERT
ncbi:MAG: hypothetical protein ACLR8P_03560 [Clostridium fessum]